MRRDPVPLRLARVVIVVALATLGATLGLLWFAPEGLMPAVPLSRLMLTAGLLIAAPVSVVIALRWLERDAAQPSLLGALGQFVAPLLVARALPLERLLGAPLPTGSRVGDLVTAATLGVVLALGVHWLLRLASAPTVEDDDEPWGAPADPALPPGYRLLLIDGHCGLCQASARFVQARLHQPTRLHIAARDSDLGRRVLARHPQAAAVDSLLFVEDIEGVGELLSQRWDAVALTARELDGAWWRVAHAVTRTVPRRLLDWGYALVAALRRRQPPAHCPHRPGTPLFNGMDPSRTARE
jgi:predicted DCC family thiol-disulfide oxidoreductase YuxK